MKNKTLSIGLIILLSAFTVVAQTTEFTYQGQLQSSSAPATGSFDFEFLLFDALSGGTQIGSTLTRSGVSVANGIFSVKLDFGSNYPGANRFLEIHVVQTGGGAFIPLTPRQAVSSAPYSVKSLTADNATNATNAATAATATNASQLGGVAANQYVQTGDARLTDARPPTAGSANYIQNTTTTQTGNFNISGNGTVGGRLLAERVAGVTNSGTGVTGDSRNGDGVFGSGTRYGVFANTQFGSAVYGSSGLQGSIALEAQGTSWFQGDTTTLRNTTGTGIIVGSAPSLGYIQAFEYSSGPKILALNNSGGNVGIGTAAPNQTLDVNGQARIRSIPQLASFGSVCFNQAGDLLQCGASSLRWKTNVQSYRSGLDVIQRLRPISFNWKEDGRPDIGLGAEDVAIVAPSLTFVNSKGEAEGVKYERLNILLINAVKEQQSQIALQQRQIDEQRKQIRGLTRIVRAINSRAGGRGRR